MEFSQLFSRIIFLNEQQTFMQIFFTVAVKIKCDLFKVDLILLKCHENIHWASKETYNCVLEWCPLKCYLGMSRMNDFLDEIVVCPTVLLINATSTFCKELIESARLMSFSLDTYFKSSTSHQLFDKIVRNCSLIALRRLSNTSIAIHLSWIFGTFAFLKGFFDRGWCYR